MSVQLKPLMLGDRIFKPKPAELPGLAQRTNLVSVVRVGSCVRYTIELQYCFDRHCNRERADIR